MSITDNSLSPENYKCIRYNFHARANTNADNKHETSKEKKLNKNNI